MNSLEEIRDDLAAWTAIFCAFISAGQHSEDAVRLADKGMDSREERRGLDWGAAEE